MQGAQRPATLDDFGVPALAFEQQEIEDLAGAALGRTVVTGLSEAQAVRDCCPRWSSTRGRLPAHNWAEC